LDWADVIVCEWCQANAVWYSRNKRAGQRLVVRFHRFELENDMPGLVDIDRVDLVVFVAEPARSLACGRFGWTGVGRQRVVWNAVDTRALDRPKSTNARTTIGLLGWVPRLKRLDRALDVLESTRAVDGRFRLLVKGNPSWLHPWIWRRESERWYVADLLERIRGTPQLRNAVAFDSFGPVEEWFR